MFSLEKVLLPGERILPKLKTRAIDYSKVLQLNDEEFKEYYLEIMAEFKTKDNWWSNREFPKCDNCHEMISGPENLRRYYGLSLHPSCFRKIWARDSKNCNNHIIKKYFERIAQLSD